MSSPRGRFYAQVSDRLPALDDNEKESGNSTETCQFRHLLKDALI